MKNLIFKAVSILVLTSITNVTNAQFLPPNLAWAVAGSMTGTYAYSDGIRSDNAGFVYATGRSAGTMNFGGQSIVSGGACSIWNAKINTTTGAASWLRTVYATGGYDYP